MAGRHRDRTFVYAGITFAVLATRRWIGARLIETGRWPYALIAILSPLVMPCLELPRALARHTAVPAMDWAAASTTVAAGIALALALMSTAYLRRRHLVLVGRSLAIASSAIAWTISALLGVVAWVLFTDRLHQEDMSAPLASWVWWFGLSGLVLFPILVGSTTVVMLRKLSTATIAMSLAAPLFYASLTCLVALTGTLMATAQLPPQDPELTHAIGSLMAKPALAILLGASLTLALGQPGAPTPAKQTERPSTPANDSYPVVARTSVFVLILLGLGISQVSGYAGRMSQLIELRRSFANQVLAMRRASLPTTLTWADISFTPLVDGRTNVQVTEARGERWVVRTHGSERLPAMADRYDVAFGSGESPLVIYRRAARQLSGREIEFPGTAISIDLALFTSLVPLVVVGALVLLIFRARSCPVPGPLDRPPWVLVDADRGAVKFLATLWFSILAIGPCALAVVVAEALALMVQARGHQDTPWEDLATFGYALTMTAMLLTTSSEATRSLFDLRRRVHGDRASIEPHVRSQGE